MIHHDGFRTRFKGALGEGLGVDNRNNGGEHAGETVLESDLLDVTELDFDRLRAMPDSTLRAALHRVLAERVDMPERYTIFDNAL